MASDLIELYFLSTFKAEVSVGSKHTCLACCCCTTLTDLRKSSPDFEVTLSTHCEVLHFHSSAQAVGNGHHYWGRKGTSAFRVSPRIMDCWGAAKLIVRIQKVSLCVHTLVWLNNILHEEVQEIIHMVYESEHIYCTI